MTNYSAEFGPLVIDDFINFFAGERLGGGVAREVFQHRHAPGWVIKVERQHHYQNVLEWDTWCEVWNTEHAKWFAPVRFISPCGKILIQEKTEPLKCLPKEIPAHFTDVKLENMGRWKGRPVFHDYGMMLALRRGLTKRMKKAKVLTV